MSIRSVFEKGQKRRKNSVIIRPDTGWLGPKPAKTKAEKIAQIKTEFIDERALLIEGAEVADFAEYLCIPAKITTQELIKCVDSLKKKKTFMVVEGMDKVSAEEQEKFVPLLKDRQILYSKLPEKVQILIPVKKVKSVSRAIQSLAFTLKV